MSVMEIKSFETLNNHQITKAKSRTTKHLVRELLFADDSALVAHTASDIQLLVDRFSMAASQFSLRINHIYTKIKTYFMALLP